MGPVTLFTPISGPAEEPVTPEELRAGMRIDADIDPTAYGAAARGIIERFCNRPFGVSTYRLDLYAGRLATLPLAIPFLSMELSQYRDETGALAELEGAAFVVRTDLQPAAVELTAEAPESTLYRFEYKAGTEGPVPPDIKQAIISAAAWLYNQPDGGWPQGTGDLSAAMLPPVIQRLAGPYRMDLFSWGRLSCN